MKRLKRSFRKWLLVSMSCLLLGFLLGQFKMGMLQDSLASMKADLQNSRAEKVELSKKIAGVEASLITDKQTITILMQENEKLHDELNVFANKLYFYERVVAPELHSSGVQIYSFSVHKNSEKEEWRYELVLMQAQKGRRLLKGTVALNFSVFENDHLKMIPITELSDTFTSTFKFKYFQTIQGVFRLPPEVRNDEIILKINVPGNRWHKGQRVEQRYNWQTLIKKENENLMGFAALK